MVDSIKRWYSYFIIMYSGLLPTFANIHCPKPVLSENTQVVQLHSDVNLTCPGCHGQTWWSRHNQTRKLQDGSHLSLTSISYEDEDTYTCHRDGTPACTTQLLVKDDIEKPQISCYIRHPTHNITCDWQTTRELRPHAKVTLIAWMLKGNHKKNRCTYIPLAGKFTCSTLYKEGDTGRHVLSLCVIGRTDSQTSNTVDSTSEMLVQPDPPINVTVTSLEHQPRKLRVSWSPPRTWLNNFYQLQYQVQYHVEGTQHVSNGTTFDEHFMINDALQRRRHVVRVRAKEEFMVTWSAWSEETVGTPWSAKEESEPLTTTDFIMTSAEEEEPEAITAEKPPAPVPRYVLLVAGVSFVMVLVLFLGILMRNGEMKLLKLKGGLLRVLFQPSQSAPTVPQPRPAEPLLTALCPFPEAVTVTTPKPS